VAIPDTLKAGMLLPNPSLKSVIFWQWANQTLNVAVSFSTSAVTGKRAQS
jgi:hypothetical protein